MTILLGCVAAAGSLREGPRSLMIAAAQRSTSSVARPERVAGWQSSQDHYSTLNQINRKNVKKLVLAWKFDTGEGGNGSGLETNPLIVGRVMYAYTPLQKVIAVDASNGKLIWKFDSGIKGRQPVRGVTYWADQTDRRVLCGVMNFIYELDAATGKPISEFGENGRIDLRKGLGGNYLEQSIALTSPGVIYKDLIIVGGRNPETPPAPPGDIRAFDVRSGKLVWRFHTIPRPGEVGYSTWPPNAWRTAGAANNWAGMTVDDKRGIVYVPTGSAVPDFYGGARVGDDLFADTLLALNAATGRMIWYFQGVHHDLWDRDFPSAPALLTVQHDGKRIDAVAQTTKQGFVFLLDRDTGRPIFPVEERKVVQSVVPGEATARTQPFPVLPAPFARQSITANDLTQRTAEAHAAAVKEFNSFISGNEQFYPLTLGKETIAAPGFDGGAEWGGPAVDRAKGVIYINSNNTVNTGGLAVNDIKASLGLKTYQTQCALCHRDDRAGSPPEFPSLLDIDHRITQAQIIETIHGGKGRMPSYPNITDGQLDALLEYLRTGKSMGASVPPTKESAAFSSVEMQHNVNVAERSSKDGKDPGAEVYARNCAICHGDALEGIAPSFPALTGIGDRLTATQITTTVRSGKGRMPAFSTERISNANVQALMRFIKLSDLLTTQSPPEVFEMERYRFTGYHEFNDPEGYPAIAPPWGTLNAIDMNTGKYLWRIPLGEYPELAAKGMPDTGTENYGGPIVTAGGLVIIGATAFDNKIRAFSSGTGKLLWEYQLPFAAAATPTTYMLDGKQYIVIAAGGSRLTHGAKGGFYVAFRLP